MHTGFFSNGGFHASGSVPMANISLPCSCYITLLLYMTMNVVQLPNKVTSFMISIFHSFIGFIWRQLTMLIAENELRG